MLSSKEIYEKWIDVTKTKSGLPIGKCFLLAVLAGLYIALGGLGATLIQASAGPEIGKLLGACVFPAGLIMIVLCGGELFTGNCLMAGPLSRGQATAGGVLKNLVIVYLGNMAGALLGAVLATAGGVLAAGGEKAVALAAAIARAKTSLSLGDALLRGFGCNVLVCAAVWAATGARSAGGKAVACFFPVMLFVLCGFEHCVANMYYVPAALLMKRMPRYQADLTGVALLPYFLKNLLPVTLGNLLGGAFLATAYAQIHHKKETL